MPNLSVFITGASSGIGEACALALDIQGWRVFAGVRKQADGESLRAKARGALTPVLIDVTDSASIAAAANTVGVLLGESGLAGLVNNAGISVAGPLEFVPTADLRRQFEVNVIGQVAVTQAFLPYLRREQGRVVNMGSLGGRFAWPYYGAYSMSKFALEAFNDSLRRELRYWGLHVCIIEPGSIATPIWGKGTAQTDSLLESLPPAGRTLYGFALKQVRQGAANMGQRGISPESVARVVIQALTAKRPKTRYLVGRDAHLIARLAWLLPDRLMDWALSRLLSR